MLTVLALTTCALSGIGCTDEDLTGPRHRAAQEVAVNTVITADTLCVRTQFTITSATAVTTIFPSRATCTTKLVLIRGQAATWAQSPNRRLTLFVRLLNKSGQTLQMPVRLYLPSTGITVLAPSGTPASKVVPLGPDSAEAGGGKIWFVGGTGTLAANDSTVQDTIRVNVMSPVTQARLQFQASASGATPLPPVPSSVNWPLANPLIAVFPADTSYHYYRNVIGVQFDTTAPNAGILFSNLLSKYSGTILGGIGQGMKLQMYVLQVQDPGPTYASLDSLTSAVRNEPGVLSVTELSLGSQIRLRGRYPNDAGIAPTRQSWLGGGTAMTYPWIAVRAPLAWGCETGSYGGTLPRIAIADAFFDNPPTDLGAPSISAFVPSNMHPDPGFASAAADHGIAVAGIVAARGDNSVQMAGIVWNANLDVYAFGTGQLTATSHVQFFADVLKQAKQRGAKVINFSFGVGNIQNASDLAVVESALKEYLDSGPDRLVVIAAGDNSLSLTLNQLAVSTLATLTSLDRVAAMLALSATYKGKLLFVTGTDQSGAKRAVSNVWTGANANIIAAPAVSVHSLTAAGGLIPWSGTSFAAPFVTGVAAQLWTMMPGLPADSVRDFIIRGATQPRVSPTTGVSAPPANIGVNGIYQLDAYGALSLLSQERVGTPICGYDVRFENGAVVLAPPGGTRAPYPVATPYNDGSVSVAQGGRRIAVGSSIYIVDSTPPQGVTVIDHLGAVIHTLPNVHRRLYLERDTADIRYVPPQDPAWLTGRPLLDLWGPGRTAQDRNLNILGPFVSGDVFGANWIEVSPAGDYAAALMLPYRCHLHVSPRVRLRRDSPALRSASDSAQRVNTDHGAHGYLRSVRPGRLSSAQR